MSTNRTYVKFTAIWYLLILLELLIGCEKLDIIDNRGEGNYPTTKLVDQAPPA